MLYVDLAVGAFMSQQVFLLRYVVNSAVEPSLVLLKLFYLETCTQSMASL